MTEPDAIEAARAFLANWAAMFNTRDPERITALYDHDALLHGTSQARLYVGRAQIRSYFRGTSTVAFGEQHLTALASDCVLSVGTYTFTRKQDGRPLATPARYTFVLRQRDSAWRVLHHHSSAAPA